MRQMRLIFDMDTAVAGWVAERIPHMAGGTFAPPFTAIGVADEAGNAVAGIVYHEYRPAYSVLEISMASTTWRWAQPGVIRALLHYPFEQLGVNKVYTAMPHTNMRAIRFNRGIGFTQEAILASHFGPKVNAVICRLLRKDYDRLSFKPSPVRERSSGQEISQSACGA